MEAKITCCSCGVAFLIPKNLRKHYVDSHETFYCPRGHQNYYPGETEEDRLRKLNTKLLDRIREVSIERNAIKYKYKDLKHKMRSTKCPKCNKRVIDLPGHTKRMHPDKCPPPTTS